MNKKRIITIDPGKKGAMAFFEGRILDDALSFDFHRKTDGKYKEVIRTYKKLFDEIKAYSPSIVVVEDVRQSFFIGRSGVAAACSLASFTGAIEMACSTLEVPIIWVTARRWKKDLGLTLLSDPKSPALKELSKYEEDKQKRAHAKALKNLSVERARKLWPNRDDLFDGSAGIDRAEACLIGEWYYSNFDI